MAGEYDLNLSNGSVFATLYPLETNGPDNVSTPRNILQARPTYPITVANEVADTFTVLGTVEDIFRIGFIFEVVGSTGNNGTYTVAGVNVVGGTTEITTVENFTDPTDDGAIIAHIFEIGGDVSARFIPSFSFTVQNSTEVAGVYTVDALGSIYVTATGSTIIPVGNGNIRDQINTPILIPYGEIVYTVLTAVSSLQLPGKGTLNYGEKLIEDLIRITENFAADSSPDANAIIGTLPAATPLVGQLWYNTTVGSEGFNVWTGTAWTKSIDVDRGAIIFRDVENANNDIYVTASETNLPAPWPGGGQNQPGLVVWNAAAPVDFDPIFRVMSQTGERFRVEHHTTPGSAYIRTQNNFESTSAGDSQFYGRLAIGGDGNLPTHERSLTVEGNGVAINGTNGADARLVLDAATSLFSSIDFEINNIVVSSIKQDAGSFLINGDTATDVSLVTGGGSVGINQLTPSATLDVVGTTELNGTTNIVASDFVVNTDLIYADNTNSWVGIKTVIGSATDAVNDAMEVTGNLRITGGTSQVIALDGTIGAPSYTFSGDRDTGLISGGAGILALVTDGATRLTVSPVGAIAVTHATYETLVTTDDIVPNKKYVDDSITTKSWLEPVRVLDSTQYATSAAFPVTGTIDGVVLSVNDRVLFSGVVNAAQRDVYIWDGAAWQTIPVDVHTRQVGDAVYVREGTDATMVYAFAVDDRWDIVGISSGVNIQYETQTATVSQTLFTLASVNYSIGTNRLQVFVDGVKQVITLAYTETSGTTVTFAGPSPFVGGEILEFIAYDELTSRAAAKREQQTGLTGTPVITFSSLTYQLNADNLLVFLNGAKQVNGINYTETTSNSITWITPVLLAPDVFEFYSSVPIVSGTTLQDVDNVAAAPPNDGDILIFNSSTNLWEPQATGVEAGAEFDYVTGITGTVANSVNVNTLAKSGVLAYQHVFLNGVLQREDLIGFAASGNYYVSGANQITTAVALVASDELLIYRLI